MQIPRVARDDNEVLCVGELLWDSLPAGLFLGGAPFNVACHLAAAGVRAAMVSRVGIDRLGEEALRRAALHGVETDLVQVDPMRPTGFVSANVDAAGNATFEILESVAWDAIAFNDALAARASAAHAVVFGTLAQRATVSRQTIQRLLATPALKVLDVNLRPPYDDKNIVQSSLERADIVKLNAGEMEQLSRWFDLPPRPREFAAAVASTFDCRTVVITRGAEGAALWREGEWTEHAGFNVEVRDTVGAGDAFLAVLLAGILRGGEAAAMLSAANRAGANVAARWGALPPLQHD